MYKAQYKANNAYEVWTNIGIYSQAGIANASSHSGRRSGLTTGRQGCECAGLNGIGWAQSNRYYAAIH